MMIKLDELVGIYLSKEGKSFKIDTIFINTV